MIVNLILIAFIHWMADFVCQTHEMSLKKSKSFTWLMFHVGVYSCVTSLGWSLFDFSYITSASVFLLTLLSHGITDYFTSKWTSRLYAKGDIHNFFVVIGFDQFIHITTLLMTYHYLIEKLA